MKGRSQQKHRNARINLENEHISFQTLLRVYRVFGSHLKKHWRRLTVAYLGLLLTVVFGLLVPWPLKLIIDHVILNSPLSEKASFLTAWFGSERLTLLGVLVIAFIVLHVIDSFFSYYFKVGMLVVAVKIRREIRERVFGHMQRLSMSFHESYRSGDLIFRLMSDLRELPMLLLQVPQNIVYRFVTIGAHIGIMWVMSPSLALTAFSVIPLLYYFNRRIGIKVRRATKKKRNIESNIASIISENATGMALVQAYGREDLLQTRFADENRQSLESTLKATRLSKVFSRISDMLVAIGTCGVAYYGGTLVLEGAITAGTLVLFISYLKKLYGPLDKFADMMLDIVRSQVAAERVLELIDCAAVMVDSPHAVTAPPFKGRVEFRNVSFGYKTGVTVLQNLNFVVEPGERIALVGHSGAGKSTLTSLLLRFYDPQQGQVLIDGGDLRDYQLKTLRAQLTVLMQEAKLFNKTVRENIAFGKIGATEEEVITAAKLAQAHDFITAMPEGYDTMIQHGGENLSGGQKQRLNIARAIIRNAAIVILDEPATALDAKAEAQIHAALEKLTQGKTTFIIAHRFSTVAHADKLLVLDEGRLAGFGTHAQLMQTCAHYRELYELQFSHALPAGNTHASASKDEKRLAKAIAAEETLQFETAPAF